VIAEVLKKARRIHKRKATLAWPAPLLLKKNHPRRYRHPPVRPLCRIVPLAALEVFPFENFANHCPRRPEFMASLLLLLVQE